MISTAVQASEYSSVAHRRQIGDTAACHELHRQPDRPLLEDGHDVGVRQLPGELEFALQACPLSRSTSLIGEHLQRDGLRLGGAFAPARYTATDPP